VIVAWSFQLNHSAACGGDTPRCARGRQHNWTNAFDGCVACPDGYAKDTMVASRAVVPSSSTLFQSNNMKHEGHDGYTKDTMMASRAIVPVVFPSCPSCSMLLKSKQHEARRPRRVHEGHDDGIARRRARRVPRFFKATT
jgi:hypothetical protein